MSNSAPEASQIINATPQFHRHGDVLEREASPCLCGLHRHFNDPPLIPRELQPAGAERTALQPTQHTQFRSDKKE